MCLGETRLTVNNKAENVIKLDFRFTTSTKHRKNKKKLNALADVHKNMFHFRKNIVQI